MTISNKRNAADRTEPVQTQSGSPFNAGTPGRARSLVIAMATVVLAAVSIHSVSIWSSQLWVYPDSIDYIVLAGGIADRGDFSHDLFLIRPPGYPLLLAAVFKLFGAASPVALLALQHLIAAATALLTAGIAWTITSRPWFSMIAGLFAAGGLQSLSYANLVLTETTYTFLLVATLFALIRYLVLKNQRALVIGSVLAGLGYLVKPVGVYLFGVCILAALIGSLQRTGNGSFSIRPVWRRLPVHAMTALLPAIVVIAPWKIYTAGTHSGDDTRSCLDYVLYLRAIEFDGLDAPESEALNDIKATVAAAIEQGVLPVGANYRDRATVIKAYEEIRGWPFARSSAVMGQAGRDAMKEHAGTIGVNTVKYAAWMLLAPDPVYRFQPGGAAGVLGKRNPDAVIYDAGTYAFGPGSWEPTLAKYRHYLPLSAAPRPGTAWWTGMTEWFYKRFDAASPVIGIADAPYSEWVIFCLIGVGLTVFTRERAVWSLLITALGAHVMISAFFGGPQTRYALPVQPILKLGGAWLLVEIVRCSLLSVRTILPQRRVEPSSVTG